MRKTIFQMGNIYMKKHEYLKLESSGKKKQLMSNAQRKKKRKELTRLKKKVKRATSMKKASAAQKVGLIKAKKKIAMLEALLEKDQKERARAKRRKKIKAMLEALLKESEKNREYSKERERHGTVKVQEIDTMEGKKKFGKNSKENKPPEPAELNIKIAPWKIRLIEKSRRMKPGKTIRTLRKEIEKSTDLKLIQAKLIAVEEQLSELLRVYSIDKGSVRNRAWKEPILSLTELDARITKELRHSPEKSELSKQNFEAMRQRIIELAEQAMLHRKMFNAARIYAFIQKNGGARPEEIAGALNLEIKAVRECNKLLLERGFIWQHSNIGVLHPKTGKAKPAKKQAGKRRKHQ